MNKYVLNFNGYWSEVHIDSVPQVTGIYIVYRCRKNYLSNMLDLIELLYIGKASDIHDRLVSHEKKEEFPGKCQPRETLCYAYAEVSERDLDIVENAKNSNNTSSVLLIA